ncbi:MAG TPA: NAD(P)-dependent oxidoreductase [Candidatus Eisenbacteria bacterium]|nr:NAD(P)-dependent oxidoreductase [Candidatus Eisenbacteria bacterium]
MYDPVQGHATAVLVTGATGGIGRAVCRELITHGYRVLGLARGDDAKARMPYAVVPIVGDVRAPERWVSAIRRVDVVIHLALPYEMSGRKEQSDAERDAEEMASVLDRLCDAVRREKKRMIHTFGALMYEPNRDGWVNEGSAISSGRGYGVRHQKAYPVLARHRKKGLQAISVNPAFVYGPGGWFERTLIEPMSRGETATVIGDGAQTMHYIEAMDAAAGYRLAIENGLQGDDYLLADDQPTTQGDFVRLVAREMGAAEPRFVPEEDLIPILGAWAVEAFTFCPKVDSTRARERLGWTPRYRTVEQGVPEVVRAWKRRRLAPAFESGIGAVPRQQ